MTTAEYRDLISAVSQARASLASAATPHEMRVEAQSLRNAIEALKSASCPRVSVVDSSWAVYVLEVAEKALAEKEAAFRRADSLLTEMAFGKDYR